MAELSLDDSNVSDINDARAVRLRRAVERHGVAALSDLVSAQADIVEAGLDLKKVVDAITSRAQQLTHSTGAVVEMLDGAHMVYWSGSGSVQEHIGLRIPVMGSISGLCVARDELLICEDSEVDARVNREACRRVGLRSALVTPLKCDGELVGVLKVISDRPQAYSRRHVDLLQASAAFMGSTLFSALEHARVSSVVARASEADAAADAWMTQERNNLASLIRSGGIRTAFQPIVELASGRVVGREALSRFDPRVDEPVDGWFEAASRFDMSLDLEIACIAAAVDALLRSDPLPGYFALNVSPRTLVEFDFSCLPNRDDEGGWVLDITEHTEVEHYDALAERVQELRDQGFRIAIDDAGAGYSSMRHILRLNPDIVKLDISITRNIDRIPRHRQLTAAIMSFSRDSGMTIVAEGVEMVGERNTLMQLQVPYAQGYLFGRPVVASPTS